MLERGCAHPIFGPVLLIVLVLLLAMVFVHTAHDGLGGVTEVGAFCFALASVFWVLVLDGFVRRPPEVRVGTPVERGPPASRAEARLVRPRITLAPLSLPLRR